MLWDNAGLLETYQADVKPVAPQIGVLADNWATLSLHDRVMTEFAHAVAAEFRATLDAAPFNTCRFVRQIAAHHFSYAWARKSPDGVAAGTWWKQISHASDGTTAFWRYVYPDFPKPRPHLFNPQQLRILSNLPGEIG